MWSRMLIQCQCIIQLDISTTANINCMLVNCQYMAQVGIWHNVLIFIFQKNIAKYPPRDIWPKFSFWDQYSQNPNMFFFEFILGGWRGVGRGVWHQQILAIMGQSAVIKMSTLGKAMLVRISTLYCPLWQNIEF